MEKEEVIRKISAIIRRYLPAKDYKIYLFGSWAKGDAVETSDIDIGIFGEEPIDSWILMRIRGEIEAIPTLRKIDIVDLKMVDERFKANVLSYAKPL